MLARVAVKPFRALTLNEQRVANLCAEHLPDKEIARQLGLSPRTVEDYIRTIASLLPEDGLSPKSRVEVWATCSLLPELLERYAKP